MRFVNSEKKNKIDLTLQNHSRHKFKPDVSERSTSLCSVVLRESLFLHIYLHLNLLPTCEPNRK